MSDDLMGIIRREIERALAGRHSKTYGLVTSYDPKKHLGKVKIQPEGQETGWLPIRTSHIGNGWGMAIGLTEGDQVELTPQEGDVEALAITGVVHSDDDAPPQVGSGEILLQHKSGAKIKFSSDGSTVLSDGNGSQIHMDGSGNVSFSSSGTISING